MLMKKFVGMDFFIILNSLHFLPCSCLRFLWWCMMIFFLNGTTRVSFTMCTGVFFSTTSWTALTLSVWKHNSDIFKAVIYGLNYWNMIDNQRKHWVICQLLFFPWLFLLIFFMTLYNYKAQKAWWVRVQKKSE